MFNIDLKKDFYNDSLVCLYGNGDLITHFGINEAIDDLDEMAVSIY